MGSTLILFLYISAQLGNARIAFISLTLFACLFISSGLKVIIKRPRPRTYVPGLLPSYSFPSGHAYGTVLVGALLVFIMSDYGVSNMAIGALLVTASIVLTGVSRVYLGAHYPSDVIGGWILGAIVITLVLKTTLLT